MAVYDHTRPQTDSHLFGGHLNRLVPSLLGRFAAWNDTRATRKALSRLSDRELEDIGLKRSDIDYLGR